LKIPLHHEVIPHPEKADRKNGLHRCHLKESLVFVMAGLVPAIHVLNARCSEDVDARDIGERKRRRPSDGYARA
jgi:hypothetical protein